MKPELTIVVCTRNRAFILEECLDSLFQQSAPMSQFQVLVVDNSSTDGTADLLRDYQKHYPSFRYVKCGKVGLSHARNLGGQESATPWVGYVDDDARAPHDFVERALQIIQTEPFDCFGGTYYAWYRYGRPAWLPEEFGSKPIIRTERGSLPTGEYLSGGLFFCQYPWLKLLNGFHPELGMRERLGYGEEDEFQDRLIEKGAKIGYDPNLFIEHAVLPHKLSVKWHLKHHFAIGRSSYLRLKNKNLSYLSVMLLRVSLASLFWKLPRGVYYIISNRNYSIPNLILDIAKFPLVWSGRCFSSFLANKI